MTKRIVNHLTCHERQIIEHRLRIGQSIRGIAKALNRDHSVISREIKRNKGQFFPYSADLAQKATERKARITNTRKLLKNERLCDYVTNKLVSYWSPEQIEGRLKKHPSLWLRGLTIGHEAIYQYIYDEEKGAPWLYHRLRRTHPKRVKRYSRKSYQKVIIPERTGIEMRPEIINQKQRFGDWESDTAEFQRTKGGYLSVQKERTSHLVRIAKLTTKTAVETKEALENTISYLPKGFVKSITFDNGGEGAKHAELKREHQIKTYFCNPYSAWQKGSVENIVGLIRQYLPRKTSINEIDKEAILKIQEQLNNRPRKSLQFRTPNEILKEILKNTKSGAINSRT